MASLFSLTGTYAAYPSAGSPSADPTITAPIDERVNLDLELASQLTLTADAPVALPFGGLTGASVVVVKSVGGPVVLRLTSAEGALQRVPVDTFVVLMSTGTPYTAIDVTRSPGSLTTIKFYLGER